MLLSLTQIVLGQREDVIYLLLQLLTALAKLLRLGGGEGVIAENLLPITVLTPTT